MQPTIVRVPRVVLLAAVLLSGGDETSQSAVEFLVADDGAESVAVTRRATGE